MADYLILGKNGKSILVITDTFSGLCAAVEAGRDGVSFMEAFFEIWIARYGVPEKIITDQERGIFSEVTQSVFSALNIDCRFAAPDAHWGLR